MKKVLLLLTGFAFAGLVACGTAEDAKKLEDALNAASDTMLKSLEEKAATSATDTAAVDTAHSH